MYLYFKVEDVKVALEMLVLAQSAFHVLVLLSDPLGWFSLFPTYSQEHFVISIDF